MMHLLSTEAVKMGGGKNVSCFRVVAQTVPTMERRTSKSLSGLAEADVAGEERSLLMGTEGEKLTGVASLDTLVPEEELKAPLSKNQVHKND